MVHTIRGPSVLSINMLGVNGERGEGSISSQQIVQQARIRVAIHCFKVGERDVCSHAKDLPLLSQLLTFSASRQAHNILPALKTDASSSDRITIIPLTIDYKYKSTVEPPAISTSDEQSSLSLAQGRQIFTARPSQAYRWPDSLPFNEWLSQHCGDPRLYTSRLPEEIKYRSADTTGET